ncbi:MAG: RNA polymerase sporulation sigma factor SigE [Clostridia bacterium]|nr:RNA polymerase sporulation sigma factor SigE [Clostridia bacterium]
MNHMNLYHLAREKLFALLERICPPQELYYVGGPDPLPPPLTAEEEKALVARLHEDDGTIRSLLIERNLRLVVFIARKFDATGVPLEDLVSIGTIGLIKAVNTFQPAKNIKLATYASRCIENEVLMFLRRFSRTRMEVSLDEPLKTDWDGNELLLSDVLGTDPDAVSRGVEESADRQMLMAALSRLAPREKQIMVLRFGLGGQEVMTQKEVADQLGISQSYISRLEKRILRRLQGELTLAGM